MSLLEEYVAEGMSKGWDVSWYFKEEWDTYQLDEIGLALKHNTPLELWAKKEYDCAQMCVLRWGVRANLDVSQYSDPNLSAKEMREIFNRLLKEKENGST